MLCLVGIQFLFVDTFLISILQKRDFIFRSYLKIFKLLVYYIFIDRFLRETKF